MPLYEYDLYIVREQGRGDLLSDAVAVGLLRVDGDPTSASDLEGTALAGRVSCIVRRSVRRTDPAMPLEILTVAFDERSLERALAAAPDEFIAWMWRVAEQLQPATFFMMAGSDTPTRKLMFTQVPGGALGCAVSSR